MSDGENGTRDAADGATTGTGGTPAPVRVSTDRRWRSAVALLLAGPVIWTVHFLLVYIVAEAGCTGSGPGLDAFGPPVPTVVTLVATAVAALACAVAAVWSRRRWRSERRLAARSEAHAPDADGSLAFAAYVLALLGVAVVLFVGLPALVLPACGR